MRVKLEDAPREAQIGHDVEVGNVYKTQKGILYIVVAVSNGSVTALQVHPNSGEVQGAVCYGTMYFNQRQLLGTVSNLPEVLEIDWF